MRKRVLLSVLGIAILLAVSVFLIGCGEMNSSHFCSTMLFTRDPLLLVGLFWCIQFYQK